MPQRFRRAVEPIVAHGLREMRLEGANLEHTLLEVALMGALVGSGVPAQQAIRQVEQAEPQLFGTFPGEAAEPCHRTGWPVGPSAGTAEPMGWGMGVGGWGMGPGGWGKGPGGYGKEMGIGPGYGKPAGGMPSFGMMPGGITPGGMFPGGMMPGGMFPGGMMPGGMMPGGMLPGGMMPGGMMPGGMFPG